MGRIRSLVPLLFAAVAAAVISGIHGSLHYSFASVALLFGLCLLTYPVTRWLTGPGSISVILALPCGLLLNSLGLSFFAWTCGFRLLSFALYVSLMIVISILVWRKTKASAEIPILPWEPSDSNSLLVWLVVVTAAVAPAFLNVGALTPDGYAYRAYFNTDVFRNMATAGALMRSGIPPENPYFAGYPLHYYWLFHVIPAFWMKLLPGYRVEFIFVQFAFLSGLAFVSALWAAARSLVSRTSATLYLLPLFLLGGSYEGLYVLQHMSERKIPFWGFTKLNIDGILRWLEKLPQVDTLYRPLLYAPQHLTAVIMFLIVVLLWSRISTVSRRLLLLSLVFISVGYSVIVGAIVVLATGAVIVIDLWKRRPGTLACMLMGGLLGITFLALYLKGYQMFNLGHGDLNPLMPTGLLQNVHRFLFYQWGAILLFGMAGLLFWRQRDAQFVLLCVFFVLSLLFVIFVQIDVPGVSDVSLKAGYISHSSMLLFAARFIDQVLTGSVLKKRLLAVAMLVLILPAGITVGLDAYNCQDITNKKFTTYIEKPQMELYRWMKANLPLDARVQDYVDARSNFIESYVSETPPFSNRSLYIGDPILAQIFQTPKDELKKRRALAEHLSEVRNPRSITVLAHRAGIQYIVAFPEEDSLLDDPDASQFLEKIAQQEDWKLYKVLKKEQPVHSPAGEFLRYDGERVILKASYAKGFHPVEYMDDGEPARWMSQDGILRFEADREFRGTLQFVVHSFNRQRTIEIWQNEVLLFSQEVSKSAIEVLIPMTIPQGASEVRIHSVDRPQPGPSGDRRMLSFKIWELQWISER